MLLYCIHTLTSNLSHVAQAAADSDDEDEDAENFPFAWFKFDNWLKNVPSFSERMVSQCFVYVCM